MSKVFGIDLGTTYSCVAYLDEYGKPVVLKNSDGDHTTPSVVMVESKENIIVGAEAKRSVAVEPEKTVQFIKRKMGKEEDTVLLNGITYHAPEISSMILKKIVGDANDDLRQTGVLKDGEEIKDVVITCPAYFGMNERQATKTAGELAGLNVLNIINEPTAAAISYGVSQGNDNEVVLVYDLGGGTFDITVMEIKNGSNISVICTGGDDQLGGKDWDEALMKYVMSRYEEETGEDLSEDPDAVAALYIDVETWKKALTAREKVNISVNGAGGRFREELTREKFEELTEHLLNRTKNLLDSVLQKAAAQGYTLNRINKVMLVGGSSRMPQVSEMIEKEYQKTPVLVDPDEAVAKGAAIFAGNEKAYTDFVANEAAKTNRSVEAVMEENLITGEMDKKFAAYNGRASGSCKISVQNALSRTYGLEVLDEHGFNHISNMLMRNQSLPAKCERRFYTHSETQNGADIFIFESLSDDEMMEIEGRFPVLRYRMKFNDYVPKDTPLDITLVLDNSGIMHVTAIERYGNTKLDTTFEFSHQMLPKDMQDAKIRMNNANID